MTTAIKHDRLEILLGVVAAQIRHAAFLGLVTPTYEELQRAAAKIGMKIQSNEFTTIFGVMEERGLARRVGTPGCRVYALETGQQTLPNHRPTYAVQGQKRPEPPPTVEERAAYWTQLRAQDPRNWFGYGDMRPVATTFGTRTPYPETIVETASIMGGF